MHCPFCGHSESMVKDSRGLDDGSAIRRRRQCPLCGARFTTFERIELRELFVIKKSGRRVPFDREKLVQSVRIALRKRPIDDADFQKMITGIVRQLESLGESDVTSELIGNRVMNALSHLDKVAYIRYSSVYKEFHTMEDFSHLLEGLKDFTPSE
jgi:transcriptional repressor NrdR